MGVAGALRRAAGDRALPQPRGRPVRPAAPHAVRRQGHLGGVRRAVGHVDRGGRRRHRAPRPGSSSPRPACCRCRTSPTCPGRDDFRGEQHHTGRWPATPRRLRGQARRGHRHRVERRAADPGHRRRGRVAHRVPAHRQLVHAAQQRADHRRGAGAAARRLRGDPRDAEHVGRAGSSTRRTTAPPSTTPTTSGAAFFEKMWNSPGFSKLTSNYTDLLFDPAANAEWCEFIAEKIRGIVDDPETADEADPEGPPLRREAAALRHRLLRGVQPAERLARRPAARRRSCA